MELKDKFNLKIMIWVVALILLVVVLVLVLNLINKEKQGEPVLREPELNQNMGELVKPRPELWGEMRLESSDEPLVGENFEVKVMINTEDANIVVASVAIEYDPNNLELLEINSENSVLSMAVIEEQEEGRIKLVRGAPGDANYLDSDDGFTGEGELVTLQFKLLQEGEELLKIDADNSRLILDDARGTEMMLEYKNL